MPPPTAAFNPAIVLPQTPQTPYAIATPNLSHLQLFRPLGASGANIIDTSNLVLAHPDSLSAVHLPTASFPERCLDAFYRFFHGAHPFVLPREFFNRVAKDGSLDHLTAAMRYVGSLYLEPGPSRAALLEEALRLAYEPLVPKDGFLVQTLLLLILGLDGSAQQEKARQLLTDVERIAVQIALNTRPFATVHGRGIPVLEESWRRTWWDLFVVDGMIAGVHRQTNFSLFDIPSDVALPCEEHQYLAGVWLPLSSAVPLMPEGVANV